MKMGFYKLSILTTAFSHLLKIIKEHNLIFEIYGERIWFIEEKSRKIDKELPYLLSHCKTMKKIKLNKRSMHQFDYNKVLKKLIEEDVGDLSVDSFSLLVRDGILKETLEKLVKTKVIDDRFVLKFKINTEAGKEDRTKQHITNIMRIQIDKYNFKIASLDLVGIYAYQDYVKDKQLNLIEEIGKNEKYLKEIADNYFKEFITIQGVQKRIRAIKYYEIGSKNMPVLKEIKIF
jgi:hypothetical protein